MISLQLVFVCDLVFKLRWPRDVLVGLLPVNLLNNLLLLLRVQVLGHIVQNVQLLLNVILDWIIRKKRWWRTDLRLGQDFLLVEHLFFGVSLISVDVIIRLKNSLRITCSGAVTTDSCGHFIFVIMHAWHAWISWLILQRIKVKIILPGVSSLKLLLLRLWLLDKALLYRWEALELIKIGLDLVGALILWVKPDLKPIDTDNPLFDGDLGFLEYALMSFHYVGSSNCLIVTLRVLLVVQKFYLLLFFRLQFECCRLSLSLSRQLAVYIVLVFWSGISVLSYFSATNDSVAIKSPLLLCIGLGLVALVTIRVHLLTLINKTNIHVRTALRIVFVHVRCSSQRDLALLDNLVFVFDNYWREEGWLAICC